MKKITKLLSEFTGYMYFYDEDAKCFGHFEEYCGVVLKERDTEEWLVSKRFGFIKWLVNHKKIDMKKVYKNTSLRVYNYNSSLFYKHRAVDGISLVMYLSVEDHPMKFLEDVLKD